MKPKISRTEPDTPKETRPKPITVDPAVGFGRPCLTRTRIPIFALADLFKAGDSIRTIAVGFGLTTAEVEAAIRYELATKAGKRKMEKRIDNRAR